MIEILSQSRTDALAVIVSGELTHDDYEKLRTELELRAERTDGFDLLVELTDVDGLEPAAVRDDLMFTKDYKDAIQKMAVVTDDQLLAKVTDFVGSPLGELLGVEVERFDHRDDAWSWIGGDASAD